MTTIKEQALQQAAAFFAGQTPPASPAEIISMAREMEKYLSETPGVTVSGLPEGPLNEEMRDLMRKQLKEAGNPTLGDLLGKMYDGLPEPSKTLAKAQAKAKLRGE